MTWYLREPARLGLEIDLLTRAANGQLGRLGSDLVYDEAIEIAGTPFRFRITFPEDFPSSMPSVALLFPRNLPVSADVHRYRDGSLCLLAPREWHPKMTGLWIRNRTIAWCHAAVVFAATDVWPEFRQAARA